MEYDPLTREIWVCRVCRRPLDLRQWTDTDGITYDYRWEHAQQDQPGENHHPDPVRLADSGGEIVGRCDFCNEPGPIWTYPCGDFEFTQHGQHSGFVGDWAACNRCHRDIEAQMWSRVAQRNASHFPTGRNQIKRTVEALHAEFRRHRLGPARLTYGKVDG